MRACLVCLLLLLAAGCGTLRHSSTGAGEFTLTTEETDFAQALAHYAQGLILEQELGRSSAEAMEQFAEAAELDPSKHELHAKAALIALQRQIPDRAIAILEKSRDVNPDSVPACLDLAAIYQVAGKTDEAMALYSRIIRLDQTCTFAYLALARIYFDQGKDDKALAILRDGAKDQKKAPAILAFCYNKGRDLITTGQIARAIPCFQVVAQKSPSQRSQLYNLVGDLYQGMGDDKEAVESFTLATMQDTPLAESFVKLALIQAKSVPDKAIETLLRADRVIPNSPAVLFLLGYVYSSLDRFTDAIAVYDRVPTALKGSDQETPPASFYLYYGSACERAGLFEKAESVFESCLTHYPDDDTVLNYLAYMWADKGINLEKAEQYVSKALQLKPRTGAYVDTLGWIYFKQKKYRNALDKIREANELIKEDPVVTEHLGDTFNALDDKETAISNWKHSLLLDPENKTVVEKLQAQGVDVEPLLKNARKADRSRGKDRK